MKDFDIGEELLGIENKRKIQTPINDQDLFPPCLFSFDALPKGFLKIVTKIGEGVHIEPEVVAILMLAIVSGALGNSLRISPKLGYEVSMFLWVIIIASSGYGKSPVIRLLLKHIKKLQAEVWQDFQLEMKKYEATLRKAKIKQTQFPEKPRLGRHFFASDITVETLSDIFYDDPRGVICSYDELSSLVLGFNQYKNKGGNDLQHYLELFNNDSWKIDRKSGTKFIPNTGAAIFGGIQPEIMPRIFNANLLENGFLPRFLVLNAENRPSKFSRRTLTEDDILYWRELIDWAYTIPLEIDNYGFVKPKVLILSNKALDLWEFFYNDYGQKLPFLSNKARFFISKIAAYYSLKFIGILHTIGSFENRININPVVEEETAEKGVKLAQFFSGQAIKTLKLYEHSEGGRNEFQKKLIETLQRLQNEVSNNKLPLSRIKDEYDKTLPQPLTPAKVSSLLRDLGLSTEKSTGNYSYLIWEPEKIQRLFYEITVTTVTTATKMPTKVTEVTEVMDIL